MAYIIVICFLSWTVSNQSSLNLVLMFMGINLAIFHNQQIVTELWPLIQQKWWNTPCVLLKLYSSHPVFTRNFWSVYFVIVLVFMLIKLSVLFGTGASATQWSWKTSQRGDWTIKTSNGHDGTETGNVKVHILCLISRHQSHFILDLHDFKTFLFLSYVILFYLFSIIHFNVYKTFVIISMNMF